MEKTKAKTSADSVEITAADRLDTIYKESIGKLGIAEKKQEKTAEPIDAHRYKENIHNNADYDAMIAKLKKQRSRNKSIWTDTPVIPVRKSIWLDDEPEPVQPVIPEAPKPAAKAPAAAEEKPQPPTKRTVEITITRPVEKPSKKKRLIKRRKG